MSNCLLALPLISCDKDNDEENVNPVNSSTYFKPIQITDDDEIMDLTYDSKRQLKKFIAEGTLEDTYRFSYEPFSIKISEAYYTDFTFDDSGRVTSFKVCDNDTPSKNHTDYQIKYEGAYIKQVIEDYHSEYGGNSREIDDFEWTNGNLVKIESTTTYQAYIGPQTYKSWHEIQYSNIPASQWSVGFLYQIGLDDLQPLWANYQLGSLPKNLISTLNHFEDSQEDPDKPYYTDKFSYKMNKNGSIDMEFWDDDTTDGFKYYY